MCVINPTPTPIITEISHSYRGSLSAESQFLDFFWLEVNSEAKKSPDFPSGEPSLSAHPSPHLCHLSQGLQVQQGGHLTQPGKLIADCPSGHRGEEGRKGADLQRVILGPTKTIGNMGIKASGPLLQMRRIKVAALLVDVPQSMTWDECKV